MKFQNRLQVQIFNNVSLPFPSNDSDQEPTTTSDCDNKEEESPAALDPDYKKVNSPTAEASSTVPEEQSLMVPDSNDVK